MRSNYDKPLNPAQIDAIKEVANSKLGIKPDMIRNRTTKELVDLTGYTPSELIDTLTMVVVDQDIFKPVYEYIMVNLFGITTITTPLKTYDYANFTDGDTDNARDDNTIADFNAEFEPLLREQFEVEQKYHKKNKLPELFLNDAYVLANKIVDVVALQREANTKAISKAMEIYAWKKLVEKATTIDLPAGTTSIQVAEEMFKQLETYETTSVGHKGIGTNGVVSIKTVQGNQNITPELKFNSADFVLIEIPEQKTNITFDGDATYFNWGATNKLLGGRQVLEFGIYSGMDSAEKTALENTQAILVHKKALEMLEFFNYTSIVKGAKAYEVIHNFEEWDIYYRKYTPMLIFNVLPPEKNKKVEDKKLEPAPMPKFDSNGEPIPGR